VSAPILAERQMLFDGSPEKLGFNILLPAISNANTALVTKAAGYTNDELWDYVYAQVSGIYRCLPFGTRGHGSVRLVSPGFAQGANARCCSFAVFCEHVCGSLNGSA
jgi:hypothetical protein